MVKGERLSSAHERILDKAGLKTGKSPGSQEPAQPPKCPECASQKTWKDGFRYVKTETGEKIAIQRYRCRSCERRFSETTQGGVKVKIPLQILHSRRKSLRRFPGNLLRQVCESLTEGSKNLAEVKSRLKQVKRGTTKPLSEEIKGKLVEFSWYMKKEGYAESTIKIYTKTVKLLVKRGADLFDPESVKEIIAQQSWSGSRKNNTVASYTLFLKIIGQTWKPPKCHVTQKFPFIPTEEEIDQLIAGCGKKTAIFLQLLKETAMRSGEGNRLEWTNIDAACRSITLNNPEKNSLPRIFKVSSKLIDMLNALPKKSKRVFGNAATKAKYTTFLRSRRLVAEKLKNPRILRISFHTLRHWKATTLYHQTKDILYVKTFLGHKQIQNTLRYIQLAEVIFKETSDEFTSKVARAINEARELIEAGFEYVTDMDGVKIFRKRK